MARYRRVDVCTWRDRRFRELSAPPANGQTLWFFLLTGPYTTVIPGVLVGNDAGMAQSLGWSMEAFRQSFEEVESRGMAVADWDSELIWLPNGVRHNPPHNPNVVRGWRNTWLEMADCPLKERIRENLRAHCKLLGALFTKAFDESLPKPVAEPSGEAKNEPSAESYSDSTPKPFAESFPEPFHEPFPEPSPEPCRHGCRIQDQDQDQENGLIESLSTLSPSPGGEGTPHVQPAFPVASDTALPMSANGKSPPSDRLKLVRDVVDLYHDELCPPLPRWMEISSTRRASLLHSLKTLPTLDDWREFFAQVAASDFLMGRQPRAAEHANWTCNLDWLITPRNFLKVREGKFANGSGPTGLKPQPATWEM